MTIDRRAFAGLLAGAAAQIAGARVLPPLFEPVLEPALSDWNIDDVAGAYPRYAEPIGYGRMDSPGPVNPLDTLFAA